MLVKGALIVRFQSRGECDEFVWAMNKGSTFVGKELLWKKVALHAPPKVHKFRRGLREAEILAKLA